MRGAWLDPLSVRSASKLTAIKKKLEAPHSRAVSRRSKKIKRTLLLARASDGIPDEPGHAQAAPDRARASGCRRVVGAGGGGAVLAVGLRAAQRLPRRRPLQLQPEAAAPRRRRLRRVEPHEAPVRAARLRAQPDAVRRRRAPRHERAAQRQRRARRRRRPRGARVGVAERVGGAVERRPQQQLRAVEQHDGVGRADVERPRRVQLHAAGRRRAHRHARARRHERRRRHHQALRRRGDGGDRVRRAVERVEQERGRRAPRRRRRAPDLVLRVAAPVRRAQRVRHLRRAARRAHSRVTARKKQRHGDGYLQEEEEEGTARQARARHCSSLA